MPAGFSKRPYDGKNNNGDEEKDRDFIKPAIPDMTVLVTVMFKIK